MIPPRHARSSEAILAGMSIGATLSEARQEAGLTVADVSARTRIRQGLIRDIEQDEFESCGGDFYARGHIRAIAGAVGTDPRPLIVEYDAAHRPPPAFPAATKRSSARHTPADGQPAADELPEPPWRAPRRRGRFGWLVPLVMAACLVSIVVIAYRLTGGKGPQSPAASSSNRPAARTTSPGQRPSSHKARGTTAATPPPGTTGLPVTQVTPVSAAAVGPQGTSDGDNAQNASLALSGNPATPWHTDWYTTARFGNLQQGTGLLVDLGRTVTATAVTIQLGSAQGADLQLRGGTNPSDLHAVASASNAGGPLQLPLASHPHVRYVLIWFTLLPPDTAGTYQATISGVTVTASAR
jgi:cytoskeletal protein RodZ